MQWVLEDMRISDYKPYQILGMIFKMILKIISLTTCTGKRSISHTDWQETRRSVFNQVLTDERTTAFASDIYEMERQFLDCKECNWYKSNEAILRDPYVGWMGMKRFPFKEKLALHMLHYQQVRYSK